MTLIRALCLAALWGWHFTATAQITVTSATFPQVGDTLNAAVAVNPVPIDLFYGPPGAGLQWDCSHLAVGQRLAATFRPASAGTNAASFPGAQMVTIDSLTGAETYYRTSTGKLEIMGHADKVFAAETDTFAVPYLTVFNVPRVERPATFNFFDIRTASTTAYVPLPPLNAMPQSLRPRIPSTVTAMRVKFFYDFTDVVDAYGDLKVPGLAAPRPVLRIKRGVARNEIAVEVQITSIPGTWFNDTTHYLNDPNWVSFLDKMKGQLDALTEGINGGGGLRDNARGGSQFTYSYLFLSATDKEELAVVRMNFDLNAVVSANFKDFNPPVPSLRIARDAAGVAIYWPSSVVGYTVQSTPSLNPADWQPYNGQATQVGNEIRLPVVIDTPSRFFRLFRP